jgi:uncharacterized membrane protein YcaP (DUF421 family)
MDTILHTAAMYLALLVIFALFGKRSLSDVTIFDFVILLLVGEVTGEVLLGEQSVTAATLAVVTLLTLSWAFDVLTFRSKKFDKVVNDSPTLLVEHGSLIEDRARSFRVDEDDILQQARSSQGLERLDQIKYAVLERDGQISIVPQ